MGKEFYYHQNRGFRLLSIQEVFLLDKLSFSSNEGKALAWSAGFLFLYFLYKMPSPFDYILATVVGFIGLAFYTIDALAPEEKIPRQPITLGPNELIITASENGLFYVYGEANGKWLKFMIDTGASCIILSPQAASRIGINLKSLQFTQSFDTANGIGLGAPYWLKSFSIGPLEFAETEVSINKTELSESILGMSFLGRFRSFEFRGNKLFLRK